MNIHYLTPYSLEKNFGRALNEAMNLIPEGDSACLRDGDTMFLTPDYGSIIQYHAENNPGAVLTCYTNRLHRLAKEQLYFGTPFYGENILDEMKRAEKIRENKTTTPCTGPLSFLLEVIPKDIWKKVPFGDGLLGVDTDFFKDLRKAGIPILRMNNLHIWHTYRLGGDIKNTSHLR